MTSSSYYVLLNDKPVGLLAQDPSGVIAFRFTDAYRADPDHPVLSQSFEDDLSRTYRGKRPGKLPAFFANLLPEGRFRQILERSLHVRPGDDLALLAATCDDLPGAVGIAASEETLEAEESIEQAEVNGRRTHDEPGFRFSLAGVQLKFSMARQHERLVIPTHGSRGDWIVKVGSNEYPALAENEYAMMEWARAAGLDVPDCLLLEREEIPQLAKYAAPGVRLFAVRRFDRRDGRRTHQEDFMQVFGWPPDEDDKYRARYQDVAVVTLAVTGEQGVMEFVRRLALLVAIGNGDAHLKNWSLLYHDPTLPQLAPVYDQVSTIAWPTLDRGLALKYAGARDFSRVDEASIRWLANRLGVDSERTTAVVHEVLEHLHGTWKELAARQYLPPEHSDALVEHWRRVPILQGIGQLT